MSTTFVGRVRELEALERALEAARAGSGATVLVEGEAGIGKSRLVSELARRARDAGVEVLVGRSIDLIGTELPFQPFMEALRPVGELRGRTQLGVFEETLAQLRDRAAEAPVILVLEDVHWADTSSLDLVLFLTHHVAEQRLLLVTTARADEPASAERVRRVADGVRRSGAGLVLELGPLAREDLRSLLRARDKTLPPTVADAIVARSDGNPFFAEELLAAAGADELPRGLREMLTARLRGLDRRAQALLRVAAAGGRDIAYPLLQAVAALPEREVRDSLQQAVRLGILVPDQAAGTFRFRHALLAEAIYATILPGEREWLHGRLADELARTVAAAPAELAPHWAAAGRHREALVASVEAARQAEAVFGLAEARSHLERALAIWDDVPGAPELVALGLDELCAWTAELASQVGDAPRAVQLIHRAIELEGGRDPLRAGTLHERLGKYLFESGAGDTFLAAYERAVELLPSTPPSPERAGALAALAGGLHLLWRHEESLSVCEQALDLAGAVDAPEAGLRALTTLGSNLAYLGRSDEGLARLEEARERAEAMASPVGLNRAYVALTDVLTMVGRPAEAARIAEVGLAALRAYGADRTVLAANWIEALLAVGDWDRADAASADALRAMTSNYPHMPLMLRADLELGRGDLESARARLDAARPTVRHAPGVATYDGYVAELALWERRWSEADAAAGDGIERARSRSGAQIRVWLCTKGLRAQAELAALARARQDATAVETALDRASALLAEARTAGQEAASITPNAAAWRALAEAEYERVRGAARPETWSQTADAWDRLQRPPVAAYCRWREAEALVTAGASRAEASAPLRDAHAVAERLGARCLLRELSLLAERARLDLSAPRSPDRAPRLEEVLGLSPREAEVLTLVARGLTNREIADTLVISVKTASVHVSHILRKLDAPNRREAAAIAHRVAPP